MKKTKAVAMLTELLLSKRTPEIQRLIDMITSAHLKIK